MHIFTDDTARLSRWIRDEIEPPDELAEGRRGMAVRRVQEWLTLHGFGVVADGVFGPVTRQAVQRFQAHTGRPASGVVDRRTFERLVQPMTTVLARRGPARAARSIEHTVLTYARAHLAQHPREVGGQNRGPWVRLYMKGHDGPEWAWCAGFVTFLVHQAAESLQATAPIEGSFSCDSLAAQGRAAGLFVEENGATDAGVRPGSIFLVRRTSTDWTHAGLVTETAPQTFGTIEGNTNDDGHREGFEVCARSRGYTDKDFVRLS
jgi:hypothetical protein